MSVADELTSLPDPSATNGTALRTLEERLLGRTATVGIVGMGYVGLPLLLEVSAAGFPAIGVDIDRVKIDSTATAEGWLARR